MLIYGTFLTLDAHFNVLKRNLSSISGNLSNISASGEYLSIICIFFRGAFLAFAVGNYLVSLTAYRGGFVASTVFLVTSRIRTIGMTIAEQKNEFARARHSLITKHSKIFPLLRFPTLLHSSKKRDDIHETPAYLYYNQSECFAHSSS